MHPLYTNVSKLDVCTGMQTHTKSVVQHADKMGTNLCDHKHARPHVNTQVFQCKVQKNKKSKNKLSVW